MTKRVKLPRVFTKDPEKAAAKRSCGRCTACCTSPSLAVPGCNPLGGVCAHLRRTTKGRKPGCSIYEGRPKLCRDYACYWRLGVLTTKERPDKLGIIFDSAAPGLDQVIATVGVPVVLARETYPGAFRRLHAKAAILAMTHKKFGVVYVGLPGGPTVRSSSEELTGRIIAAIEGTL